MVYRMEDYKIRQRIGRSMPTGQYVPTRNGGYKQVTKFAEIYKTAAGEIYPEEWRKIMLDCVTASGQQELFRRLMDYCSKNCAWLKKEKDIEEYALEILAGRTYRCGSDAWKDFSADGATENTAFVIEKKESGSA